MNYLKTITLAAALAISVAGAAVAAEKMDQISATGALSSANSISILTVSPSELGLIMTGAGLATELVDIGSLKARVQNNPKFLAQLENYGASLDDIVGIRATNETDVTILVRG